MSHCRSFECRVDSLCRVALALAFGSAVALILLAAFSQ